MVDGWNLVEYIYMVTTSKYTFFNIRIGTGILDNLWEAFPWPARSNGNSSLEGNVKLSRAINHGCGMVPL
jgi:hypothetical protein